MLEFCKTAWIYIFIALATAARVIPASAYEIDEQAKFLILQNDMQHHFEPSELSINQVRVLDDWQPTHDHINFGYNKTPLWIRFQLKHNTQNTLKRLLEISYPLLDHIQYYIFSGDELLLSGKTGDKYAFPQRIINHRNFVFPITIPPNKSLDIYFRIQTSGSLQVPLQLWEEHAFFIENEKTSIQHAMFYGLLLVMIAFNLLLFFSLKDLAYLYFVCFVSAIAVLVPSLDGFAFQYIFPNNPALSDMLILLSVPCVLITITLFTLEFLNLRKNKPWLMYFYGLLACSAILFGLAIVLPYAQSTRLSVIFVVPVCLSALVAGIKFWYAGEEGARLFSVAWIGFLAAAIISACQKLGLLGIESNTQSTLHLGVSTQVVLFAFALASRFHAEREARLAAQKDRYTALNRQLEMENELLDNAQHHSLTGIPNRDLFEVILQEKTETEDKQKTELLVILLHLRGFDEVNKTLGHSNADKLICKLVKRLNKQVSSCGQAVCLETNNEQNEIYLANVEGVTYAFAFKGEEKNTLIQALQELIKSMEHPLEFKGLSLEINFVLGASFIEDRQKDIEISLREAFIAFDQAHSSIDKFAIYEPSMNPYCERRLTLMAELRQAIDNNELKLNYQPQVSLRSNQVSGFEALLRWTHPQYGPIAPDEFIPMAERAGLMKKLTQWVINEALSYCKVLDTIDCKVSISVNISAINLKDRNFARQVSKLLQVQAISPDRLILEVTETAAMTDPKTSLSVLNQLRDIGIGLSIDDFGTGHSSFAYIRELPVQEIKVDRSFVLNLDSQEGDQTIVRSMIDLSHSVNCYTVAEGVETEKTLQILSSFKCDIAQGYFIAKPMSASECVYWLQSSTWFTPSDEADPVSNPTPATNTKSL